MRNADELDVPVSQETEGMTFTDADVPPMNPVITTKAGWMTSEGQIAAVVMLFCAVMAYFGFNFTPDQIEGWWDTANKFAAMIIPFLGLIGTAITYINSRGKVKSNTINANSAIQVSQLAGISGVGATLGGRNWKDPQRYINIGQIAGQFIPGLGGVIAKAGTSAAEEIVHVVNKNKLSASEQAQLEQLLRKATEGR